MRRKPAPTLERMRSYDRVRRLVADGVPPSAGILAARLREEGLAVPSRETVRRWALERVSPSTCLHRFQPEPSEELSFFLGAWIGDGWADESDGGRRLVMKVRSYDFAKEFADCAAKILGKKDSYWVRRLRDEGGWWYQVKVTSLLLYKFAVQDLESIRPCVEEFPKAFLRGLYAAEGNPSTSIAKRGGPHLEVGIDVGNSDIELLHFAEGLLHQLGMEPGRIRLNFLEGKRTNLGVARKSGWLLTISRFSSVRQFADEVGFAESEKQSKLTEAISLIAQRGKFGAAAEWLKRYEKIGKMWCRRVG